MRVRDEEAWWEQLAEFEADEESRRFRDFLTAWVDMADVAREAPEPPDPRQALSKAYEVAEQSLGYLSVEWLGQMLLVVVQHWFRGDDLWVLMSPWERRLVEQATAVKLAELQRFADGEVAPATAPASPPAGR